MRVWDGRGWVRTPAFAKYARHDFWAGIHEAEGVRLFNYQHARDEWMDTGTEHPAWWEFAEGMRLIKSGLREFIVAGERLEATIDPSTAVYSPIPDPDEDPDVVGSLSDQGQ